MKHTTTSTIGAFAALAATAHAASLSVGFQGTIASEQHPDAAGPARYYHLSLNPNNPGYASYVANDTSGAPIAPFQRSFTNPIQGYSFVGGGTNGVLNVAQESGGLITYTTTDVTDPVSNTFDSFGQTARRMWVASDPGADLLNPSTTHDSDGPGYRSFGQISATVDISGLTSGTVNIFYGAFSATPQLSAVMRDLDGSEPDIPFADLHLNGDAAQRTEFYVAELDFVNDAGYDVIEYSYLQPGPEADGSGNGRSGGTVLTGVIPEPSSLALLGLGGLGLLPRRRRQ